MQRPERRDTMKHWMRVVAVIGALMLVAGAGVAAFAVSNTTTSPSAPTVNQSSDDPTGTMAPSASPTRATAEDVRGNCDEPEHANDPACAGATSPAPNDEGDDDGNDDVSGNCDEAEHANDAACSGGAETSTDDDTTDDSGPSVNAGPGSTSSDDGSAHEGPDDGPDSGNSGTDDGGSSGSDDGSGHDAGNDSGRGSGSSR
jgi:hypothetical protein